MVDIERHWERERKGKRRAGESRGRGARVRAPKDQAARGHLSDRWRAEFGGREEERCGMEVETERVTGRVTLIARQATK